MKKYLFLHYGFETPTPDIMAQWKQWFGSVGDAMLEQGHFPKGLEVTAAGVTELPLASDSITGYCIIAAEDIASAQQIAEQCPQISATRVYEVA